MCCSPALARRTVGPVGLLRAASGTVELGRVGPNPNCECPSCQTRQPTPPRPFPLLSAPAAGPHLLLHASARGNRCDPGVGDPARGGLVPPRALPSGRAAVACETNPAH